MKAWLLVMMSLLLAGCEEKKDVGWLGYGEADSAFVAAPQPGWIEMLSVERGQTVKAGDLLYVLDTNAQEASRGQAEATLSTSASGRIHVATRFGENSRGTGPAPDCGY